MSNQVSQSDEARFITREFAETIADKTSSPYFRLHDPAQKMLADLAAATRDQPLRETAYTDRMITRFRLSDLRPADRNASSMPPVRPSKYNSTANFGFEAKFWLAADKVRSNMQVVGYGT